MQGRVWGLLPPLVHRPSVGRKKIDRYHGVAQTKICVWGGGKLTDTTVLPE